MTAFHPLNGQQVTATYTKHYRGRLVDEGPTGAALRLVDSEGLTVCYVNGERWTIEAPPMDEPTDIYAEIRSERERAHAKHGDTSMEGLPLTDMTRLSVLMEEVGEVAREFNEARHRSHRSLLPQAEREQSIDAAALRAELVQTAAMAAAWADQIPLTPRPYRAGDPT
jgi:hypothetical protein